MGIEQAIYGTEAGQQIFLARSAGFREDWLPLAERICKGFGQRPEGIDCPLAVFALPLDGQHIAVVQVADQTSASEQPPFLAFRLLVLPKRLYSDLGGEPFYLAEQFPPSWSARGELPVLDAPPPAPYRTVENLRKVLDVPYCPTLLGGVQVLIDGGRLVFERTEPDSNLVRSLWALLPISSRAELWPASFAFSNEHQFHVVLVPRANGPQYEGYVIEAQAGDYPEGNYEHALQAAIEDGDQSEVDGLFARRSRSQMLWLGITLLIIFTIGAIFLARPPAMPTSEPAGKSTAPAKEASGKSWLQAARLFFDP